MPNVEKARRERAKQEVLFKLEGFSERQAARNVLRAMTTRMSLLRKLRRLGHMNTLEGGRETLHKTGLTGWEESYYGITILHSSASVSLAYDRQGKLSWASRPKQELPVQESFEFSDEMLASSAEDEDFLRLLAGLH